MTTPDGPQRVEGLLERLRAAPGPDRNLDLAIGIALLDWGDTPAGQSPPEGRPEYNQPNGHFTSSLDAALALVERVLGPHEDQGFITLVIPLPLSRLIPSASISARTGGCEAPTAPLAVLIALLSALGAKTNE